MKNLKELRKETIKKLEDLKENFTGDIEENYTEMVNIMIDYDNEAQDSLYLYDRSRDLLEVVDDEFLHYILEDNNKGCFRLFYLTRGIEYPDNIYKVNAYGNLENISDGDLDCCIDDALENLKEAL